MNFALSIVGCFDESAGYPDTHFHRATSVMATTTTIATARSSRAGFREAVDPALSCLAPLFRAFFFLLLNWVSNHLQSNINQPYPPESSIRLATR